MFEGSYIIPRPKYTDSVVSFIFLIVATLLCTSCSFYLDPNPVLPSFSKVWELELKDSIDLESLDILNPTAVYYRKGFLVFTSSTGKQELQFLNLEDGKVFTKSIVGEGPDEVMFYEAIRNSSSAKFHLLDYNLGKVLEIDLDSLRNDPSVSPHLHLSLKESLFNGFENENYMYFNGMFEQGRFMCYDKKTKQVAFYGLYPEREETESLSPMLKGIVYNGTFMTGNDKYFVSAYSGLLDFHEILSNGALKIRKSHHYSFPHFTVNNGTSLTLAFSKKDKAGFINIDSDDEKVYLLYSDKTSKEYGQDAFNCPYLMTYDWDGNPLCEYHLEKSLRALAVNGKTVYGLNREKEAIIYIYELP